MSWIFRKVDEYYDWLRENTYIGKVGKKGWEVISTPFLGLFNDPLEIYVKKEGDSILLSDDRNTFYNLEQVGVSTNSKARRLIIDKILNTYSVIIEDNELIITANETNFSQRFHDLLQVMQEINDLYVLNKHNVSNVFKEDVQDYLDEQNIVYTTPFIARGSIEIFYTFDFQIAYPKKEIVIKCFNSIDRVRLTSFLFMWQDVSKNREGGKEISALAFINDKKDIDDDYKKGLKNSNTNYIEWKKRYFKENKAKLAD